MTAEGHEELQSVDPKSAGVDGAALAKLTEDIRAGKHSNIHALLVLRSGKLVVEKYFQGADERRGNPLDNVRFNAGTLHDLRSVTKSVTGALAGIAVALCDTRSGRTDGDDGGDVWQSSTDRQHVMNRMFDDFLRNLPGRSDSTWPQIEVSETDAEANIVAELAGLEERNLDMTLRDGVLTLKGQKRLEKNGKAQRQLKRISIQ